MTSPAVEESRLTALGDEIIRGTIWLSLACYGVAAVLSLRGRAGPVRSLWTLAWLAYVVHVAAAFHFFHQWSHARAIAHTQSVSGFGEGLYVSYLFTLLWSADITWWWLSPRTRERRPRWLTWGFQGFLAFMIFNATVVFETGVSRWAGVALCDVLSRQGAYRLARPPG